MFWHTYRLCQPHQINNALSSVNHEIVANGEHLPVVKLKDGTPVQTGTVAAMLVNVARYNTGERGQMEEALALSVPTLIKVGLFDLFSPAEWQAGNNAGRRLVGQLGEAYLNTHGQGTQNTPSA
ncbi:hypothetical protein [Chitinivorax sp. B]|uniref:DUF7709 family protein n=1 Tax=Chitinivorax sp. B TaxID=2502235 RepID=UPI0010F9D074|nr:hypothetical protein [Chitinivorax sp. B]